MIDQADELRRLVQQNMKVRPGRTRAIAVTSGKGGVGKSNISANLAICLAKMGYRMGILDGDLGLANVNIILGVNANYDIGHVISGQKRITEIAVPGPQGLQVFAGGSGLYEMANLSSLRLESLMRAIGDVDTLCDTLLIDTGAGLAESVIRLVLSAAEVLVITTPEPTALTDAYGIIKVIARRSPGSRVHLVVNMVRREGQGLDVFHHFQGAINKFLKFEVHYLGEVPYDPVVTRAVQEQTPFVLAYPHSHAAQAVENLARNLMGIEVSTAGGIRGLFQRMLRNHR